MYKTALAFTALLSVSHAAELNSGATVSVQLGYGHTNVSNSETLFFEDVNSHNYMAGNGTLSASNSSGSFSFAAAIGYHEVLENGFIVGLELSGSKTTGSQVTTHTFDMTNTDSDGKDAISRTCISHKFSVTPSVVFGYKVTDCFAAHLKIGANIARFNLDNQYDVKDALNADFASTDCKTFTKTGLEIGLGGEYALTDCISLTGDVSYTYFNAVNVNLSNPTIQAAGVHAGNAAIDDAKHTASIKPRFVTVRLGARYRF